MAKKIRFWWRRLQAQGLVVFMQARLLNAWYFILQRIYGFATWNIFCTYFDKPYKAKAVAMIEQMKAQTVVEIGCGLGEIISRVTSETRLGFDIDAPAVRCARYLNGKKARFFYGNFLDPQSFLSTLAAAGVEQIDVLVLINWIHEVEVNHILRSLAIINGQVPVHHVLMDAIKPEFSGYKYRHSLADMARFGDVIESVDADEVRYLHMFTLASFDTNQLSKLGKAVGSTAVSPAGGLS